MPPHPAALSCNTVSVSDCDKFDRFPIPGIAIKFLNPIPNRPPCNMVFLLVQHITPAPQHIPPAPPQPHLSSFHFGSSFSRGWVVVVVVPHERQRTTRHLFAQVLLLYIRFNSKYNSKGTRCVSHYLSS